MWINLSGSIRWSYRFANCVEKDNEGSCIYGNHDCPEVWTLRRFRDDVLRKHLWGRAFVRAYYRISSGFVEKYGSANWFRRVWKKFLDIRLIWMCPKIITTIEGYCISR